MKKSWFILLIISIGFIQGFSQTRSIESFNDNWKFCQCNGAGYQASGFNDASWTSLSTPHTWNNMDGQDGGNNYVRGIGWYRKHFTIGAQHSGKKVFVRFQGVNMSTEVYVNGALAGSHVGGYSAFVFDISSLVNGSDNVIAVKVNNSDTIKAPPLEADFTFFGGIYRPVELLFTNSVHITPLDFGGPGFYITQDNVSASSAELYFKTFVKNASAISQAVHVDYTVLNAASAVVATQSVSTTLTAGQLATLESNTTLTNPTLWNGKTNPYLYSVKASVYVGANLVDEVIQPLGIRFFSVDVNTGFYLNGNSYRLKGVAHHEDYLDKGRAASNADRKKDLDILQEMGCNYIRLSHYQHGDYAYNYCDSNGLVTWTEIPLINRIDASATFTNNTRNQLKELIRQNYNHPSVLIWGLSNEITYKAGPDPSALVQELSVLAKQEDSTRLTASAAMHSERALNFYSDIYSCNVYNGWYYNTYNDFGTWATNQHSTYPAKGFGVSEYGAGANVTQHEPLNPAAPLNYGPWHPEEYQALFHEAHWQQMLARPYLWSTSVWVGFDFASDGRNEGAQPGINDKGLITRDRQVKKDAFYYYKANWTTEPFVYITSRRFSVRYDSVLTAKIYSNCDSVKLKINSVQLATKTSTNAIFSWTSVALVRGLNTITSIGYKNGQPYYDTCYWTFNGPYKIVVPPAPIQINFEASATITPAGYLKDFGSVYGARGNGYTYGWSANNSTLGRERASSYAKPFDTFMHMQYQNGFSFWEIEVPNGPYRVSIVAGDPGFFDSYHAISAEGVLIVRDAVYSAKRHTYGSDTVEVVDGKLTIRPATGSGATNAKINFIHIEAITVTETDAKGNSSLSPVVFPNPANDAVSIFGVKESVQVRILELTGKEIQSHYYSLNQPIDLDTSELQKGVYVISVEGETIRQATRLLIE